MNSSDRFLIPFLYSLISTSDKNPIHREDVLVCSFFPMTCNDSMAFYFHSINYVFRDNLSFKISNTGLLGSLKLWSYRCWEDPLTLIDFNRVLKENSFHFQIMLEYHDTKTTQMSIFLFIFLVWPFCCYYPMNIVQRLYQLDLPVVIVLVPHLEPFAFYFDFRCACCELD